MISKRLMIFLKVNMVSRNQSSAFRRGKRVSFQKIKELEDINRKRGQSEQTLNLLTNNLKEKPFYKAKSSLGFSENNTLKKAPNTLYDFDQMSASKAKPAFKGRKVIETVVRLVPFVQSSSDE